MFLSLEPIPEKARQQEREIMAKFEAARPRSLGALLDVMVRGLRALPDVELEELPRMADFACWIVACEAALWRRGTFIQAYNANIAEATKGLVETDMVAAAV